MASSLLPGMDPNMIPAAKPPPGVMPNFINPVTLANNIVAVASTVLVLTAILLSIRLFSTLKITRSASYDDCAIVIAMVLSTAYAALIIDTRDKARHGWDVPISAYTTRYFKIILSETVIAAFGFLFSKLSILLLLFRVFSPTRMFRYCVYNGMFWTVIISLVTILVAFGFCAPRTGESFNTMSTMKRCGDLQIWAVVQGALYVILDFYILFLPIPMVWNLQMDLKRKVGVTAIFLTGFIACFASILSLAYKTRLLSNTDTLWNSARVCILNIVELNVAIMVACMPACASFLRHFSTEFGIISSLKSRLSSSKGSQEKTPQSASSSDASGSTPRSETHPGGNDRYRELPDPVDEKRDAAPEITSTRKERQSRMLRNDEWDLIEDRMFPRSSHGTKRGTLEKQTPSFEKEKPLAVEPHDIV